MTPVIPTVPVLTERIAAIFGHFDAQLGKLREKLEKEFPGSGTIVDGAQEKLDEFRKATDVPAMAQEFLTEAGKAFGSGRAPVVPHITDLAR